ARTPWHHYRSDHHRHLRPTVARRVGRVRSRRVRVRTIIGLARHPGPARPRTAPYRRRGGRRISCGCGPGDGKRRCCTGGAYPRLPVYPCRRRREETDPSRGCRPVSVIVFIEFVELMEFIESVESVADRVIFTQRTRPTQRTQSTQRTH